VIRIGTSSWDDPEFVRDWYPKGLPAGERLAWYAEHFDYVEVNSTFYGVPAPKTVERWAAETPGGFLFDVKFHRLFSGHATAAAALPRELRADLRVNGRGHVLPTPELLRALGERFQEGLEPLRAAGKLGTLLLQMTPGFSPRSNALADLEQVFDAFEGSRVAVELRNRNWLTGDRLEATLSFFRERSVPLVLVDAPQSEHFTVVPAQEEVTDSRLAYLRLHGRDEHAFLTGKTIAERFDYDYSDKELDEVAARVRRLAEEAEEVHVACNNNRSDYAPKAARALRARLR